MINVFAELEMSKSMEVSHRISHLETIPPETPIEEKTYIKLYLRPSDYKIVYQSMPYNILEFTGVMGGILSALLMLAAFLIQNLVYHLF